MQAEAEAGGGAIKNRVVCRRWEESNYGHVQRWRPPMRAGIYEYGNRLHSFAFLP